MPATPQRTNETIRAYLARLGLEPEPPSIEALDRLHRAHVERIPWETLWIHLGERWNIDPGASMARIARTGRGGYCFHLNGAFGALLQTLGYDVTLHVGGVHGPSEPTSDVMGNHLVLTVGELPSDTNPDGTWYVDVALGDGPYRPIPLRAGDDEQAPFRYSLAWIPGDEETWRVTSEPHSGFHTMTWRPAPATMDAFAGHHSRLSTDPTSGFARVLVVQRRTATGVDTLRARTLTRGGDGSRKVLLGSASELLEALRDVFGLDLSGVEASRIGTMWDRAVRAHEEWLASQQTGGFAEET